MGDGVPLEEPCPRRLRERSWQGGSCCNSCPGVRGCTADFAHAQCRCDPRQVAGRSGDKLCDRVACERCQCEQKTLKPCAKTCSRSSPPARLRCVTQSARMPLTNGS